MCRASTQLMLRALAVSLPPKHRHTNTQRMTPAPNVSLHKFKHRLSAGAQTGITTLKKKKRHTHTKRKKNTAWQASSLTCKRPHKGLLNVMKLIRNKGQEQNKWEINISGQKAVINLHRFFPKRWSLVNQDLLTTDAGWPACFVCIINKD